MNGTARDLQTPVLPIHSFYASPTVNATGLVLLAPLLLCAFLLRSRLSRQRRRVPFFSTVDQQEKPTRLEKGDTVAVDDDVPDSAEATTPYADHFPRLDRLAEDSSVADREQMVKDKELYWELQNLEDQPAAIERARSRLLNLLDKSVSEAQTSSAGLILSVPTYSRDGLRHFLDESGRVPPEKYRAYLARRKAGGPREMFPTREYVIEWLRLASVVKYVDGGWLGSVWNVATGVGASTSSEGGRLERRVGNIAWQVISEEFGDGNLEKNHIYLWKQLARELHLGKATNGSPRCWAAAVAQQCIGLLAGTGGFFPEALGFNMAYECLQYHLLVTAIGLRELQLNDYYSAIHITIDDADMGYSAMARMAVERYIEGSGFIFAEGLPTTPSSLITFEQVQRRGSAVWQPAAPSVASAGPIADERKMVDILMRKAPAADGLQCPSRIMVEGHPIEHWLDPTTVNPDRALLRFLRGLSAKKPWSKAGDVEGSKLVKLVQWEGKMFGAFSKTEVEVLKAWIGSLRAE